MPVLEKTPKHRTITAIILALLLHLMVALVLYVTLYERPDTDTQQATHHTQPAPVVAQSHDTSQVNVTQSTERHDNKKTMITKQKTDLPAITTPTQKVAQASKDASIAKDKAPKQPANMLASTVNQNPLNSSTNTPDIDTSSNKKANTRASNNNTSQTAKNDTYKNSRSANDNSTQQLQTTAEYEHLEDELEENAERLFALINTVKERNQQQINEQRASQSIKSPKPTEQITTPDYPISPITSLDKSKNN